MKRPSLAQEIALSYDAKGSLRWRDTDLSVLAQKYGTPLYVYQADLLLEHLSELKKALAPLPQNHVFFALKANSSGGLLRLLSLAEAGADLVSGGELFLAKNAGFLPEKTLFSGVGKMPTEIIDALSWGPKGIRSFNVESEAELALLEKIAAQKQRVARVALRLNPDVDAKTHPYISTGLKENKFGLDAKTVLGLMQKYGKSPHLNIGGLSIHIGSQILSLAPLREAFVQVRELLPKCQKALGRPLKWLDLGGGLGVRYANEAPPSLTQYGVLIARIFADYANALEFFVEPGRALVANAGVLLTQVLYRKTGAHKKFVIVDASMSELIRPALYQSYHEVLTLKRPPARAVIDSVDIVGPVCESGDFLAHHRRLARSVNSGNYLALLSTGAYGFSMANHYNSRPLPAEVILYQGREWLARKRGTVIDFLRGELPVPK